MTETVAVHRYLVRIAVHPLAVALGGLALLISGCASQDLETDYGRRQAAAPLSSASVNGTDVLAGMFSEAGHDVASRRILISSEFKSVDTIVWFPDDYGVPEEEVIEWLDDWLSARRGRTLVYVGRDFDASPLYWRKMAPVAPADERVRYEARAAASALRSQISVRLTPERRKCDWFELADITPRQVHELSGPWSRDMDAAKVEIEIDTALVPTRGARPLLASGDDPIVSVRQESGWPESKLILVANGSFLLNLPLVNHENRKLAARLIAAVGTPGRTVFLESEQGGPPVDPLEEDSSLWSMFGAWPLNAILLHLAALGIIFCFARWPIFGRPRTGPAEPLADFGKHVTALGELLRRSKDRDYALAQLGPGNDLAAQRPP